MNLSEILSAIPEGTQITVARFCSFCRSQQSYGIVKFDLGLGMLDYDICDDCLAQARAEGFVE